MMKEGEVTCPNCSMHVKVLVQDYDLDDLAIKFAIALTGSSLYRDEPVTAVRDAYAFASVLLAALKRRHADEPGIEVKKA